jgi:hypothetical protein
VLLTVLLGVVGWLVLGYLVSVPLGLMFGWSGHPAIPDAPLLVYLAVYGIVLPALCLFGAWRISGTLIRRFRKGSQ